MAGPEDFVGSTIKAPAAAADAPVSNIDPASFAGHSIGTAPPPEPQPWSEGRKAATLAAAGVGSTTAAWMVKGLLRKAFPGGFGKGWSTTSAIKHIDDAIKKSDSSSGIRDVMSGYMRFVSDSDKPVTFADYMATLPGHHNTVKTIQELVGGSGNIPKIEGDLTDRMTGFKDRVLGDLASSMNVSPQSISEGLEKLKESKNLRAKPLYDEAFKDPSPIRDTKLLDLFGTNVPNMSMMNALKSRMKTLALQGREPPSLFAADASRKDAWKRLLTTEVPEQMFAGDEWGKLRKYYAPSVEDLHHMRSNLWDGHVAAKKAGDNEAAKAYLDSWKKVTNYLDSSTSGAYKKAREAYKGDSDLENAYTIGSELLTMKPDEVRVALKGMGPNERQALSAGFYGAMKDMDYQKMQREFVARPERYPDRRALLSAVITDPQRLEAFMKKLEGEGAMAEGASRYTDSPMTKTPEPRLPFVRGRTPIGGGVDATGASASLLSYIDPLRYTGWEGISKRPASRAGTDFLFREPQRGNLTSHADWDTIHRTPLSALERAKQAGRWSGAGGLGGLSIYGGSKLVGDDELSPLERAQQMP